MAVRSIITAASVWQFDEERMEFRRTPLVGGAEHPVVTYVDGWQPYTLLAEHDLGAGRVAFTVVTPDARDSLRSSYLKSQQADAA